MLSCYDHLLLLNKAKCNQLRKHQSNIFVLKNYLDFIRSSCFAKKVKKYKKIVFFFWKFIFLFQTFVSVGTICQQKSSRRWIMSQLDSITYEIDTTIVFHCRSNSFVNLSSDMFINEEASLHVTMLNKLKRFNFKHQLQCRIYVRTYECLRDTAINLRR